MPTITDTQYAKLGLHRGNKRAWFEGRRLSNIGAAPGTRYDIVPGPTPRSLTIILSATGTRTVSSRGDTPIIDINSGILAETLGDSATRIRAVFTPGRITITIAPNESAEEERRSRFFRKLAAGATFTAGSLFHGAGILDAALHQGYRDVGLKTELKFAIELEHRFLDTSVRNNPCWADDGVAISGSIDEIPPESLSAIDFLSAGIPCTGASLSGRAKNKIAHAEDHSAAGHLFVPFLQIVRAVQPIVIEIENVTPYRSSPSWSVVRACLDVMGYDIHETTLDGHALGALERRIRFAAIAVTKGMNLSLDLSPAALTAPTTRPASLAEVLDPPGTNHRWSPCEGLRAKAIRDKAKVEASGKGTGFQMQILTPDATAVPVITKDYHKWRSTDPKLAHPTDPKLLRQFSPREHAAIKGIPFDLVAGESPTTQSQMLGQSIVYPAFVTLARAVGTALLNASPTACQIRGKQLPDLPPAHITASSPSRPAKPTQLALF